MEPLPAELARIRPRIRMYEQVRTQRRGPLERLATLLTFEHLLDTMDGSVLRQTYLMPKRLITQLARERPLPIMRPPRMHLQAMRRREHFLALNATINITQRHHPAPGTGTHQQMRVVSSSGRMLTMHPSQSTTTHQLMPQPEQLFAAPHRLVTAAVAMHCCCCSSLHSA